MPPDPHAPKALSCQGCTAPRSGDDGLSVVLDKGTSLVKRAIWWCTLRILLTKRLRSFMTNKDSESSTNRLCARRADAKSHWWNKLRGLGEDGVAVNDYRLVWHHPIDVVTVERFLSYAEVELCIVQDAVCRTSNTCRGLLIGTKYRCSSHVC